jgi:hypothetical protein
VADQREHGVDGPEWRDRCGEIPSEPLVTSEADGKPDRIEMSISMSGQLVDPIDDVEPDEVPTAYIDRHGIEGPRHARQGETDGPLDLSSLRADDELLTALCSFDHSIPDDADADPELKSLLLSWRLDVDAEPIAELVDTETAMRTIEQSVRDQRRRPRYLVPLASAAAVLVIVFAGMSLAARDAHPGDTLWGLSQVLYSDHARSVEAAALVRRDLAHASQALEQGHLAEARTALAAAQASLPAVATEDGKTDLQSQQQSLLNQLNQTTSLTTPPTTNNLSTAPVVAPVTTTQVQTQPPVTTTTQAPPPATTTDQPPPPTTTDPQTPPPSTDTAPQSLTNSPQQQTDVGTTGTDNANAGADTATS